MMPAMEWSQLARWWRPIVAATVGLVLFAAAAFTSAARSASTLQVLAIVALFLAAALAATTAVALRPAGDLAAAPDESSGHERSDEEIGVAMAEVAHERDVSMARASDAEERARLAGDRLASLAPLERRVEIAERRALDAERRLDEIDERVGAATIGDAQAPIGDSEVSNGDHGPEEPAAPGQGASGEPSAAARQAAELRARLARTAARKKPDPNR
jgi:hypothetical protein